MRPASEIGQFASRDVLKVLGTIEWVISLIWWDLQSDRSEQPLDCLQAKR